MPAASAGPPFVTRWTRRPSSRSKVTVTPGGYGNALYITHDNGYTSVHGHLDRFFPEIEGEVFMKNEAFMDEVKVGFGVMVLGFLRDLFTRIIRGLTILQNKLTDAVEKRLLTGAVA